jgi:P22_AR N-terminal domain
MAIQSLGNAPVRFDPIYPVQFYDDTLVLAEHNGDPHVVMKPVVDGMGLDWKSQHVKLADKFASVMVMITTTGGDGKQYEMTCLPLRKFPAWLYSVSPSKVAPHLRDKIVRYQEECDEVLWQYWTKGFAGRQALAPTIDQLLRGHQMRLRLLNLLKKEQDAASRRAIHDQLTAVSDLLGLDTPAIGTLGSHLALPPTPWAWVLASFNVEVGERSFYGIFEYDTVNGEKCLLIRPPQVIEFLRQNERLRDVLDCLPERSPRVFHRSLKAAGVVVGECERTIGGRRWAHLVALSVAKLSAAGWFDL